MKKILLISVLAIIGLATAQAQDATDAQQAVEEAAQEITEAPKEEAPAPKPVYWTKSLMTNISFTQLALKNWVAGGFNALTLAGNIDANANYAKGKSTWDNRLQLDYGFLYSHDKPILQKNKDRMYLESKFGYATPVKNLKYSAAFSFLNQFDNNYTYGTPNDEMFAAYATETEAWKAARELKSGFFSPAYITLGLGIDWTPWDWLGINFSPLTGSIVVVSESSLRPTYGMKLSDDGVTYRPVLFQFGAQLKVDAKFTINDNFSYTTQLVLFTDYLDKPIVKTRVNWDNKIFWKLAKYFALTLSTNMIYDPNVTIAELGKAGVQWKEFLEFGFTYTIASKQ